MNKFFLLSFLFFSFFLLGCSCPDDERKGEIKLEQKAQEFVTYDGTETLIFEDEIGNTLSFTASRGMEVKLDKLCYHTTCTEAKYDSPSSCEYYDAESRRFTFFSDNNQIVLDVLLFSDHYGFGKPEFYDALQVGYSNGTPSFSAHHLIEARIEGPVELENISLSDLFEEKADIELNGRIFTNILSFEEGALALYFKEGQGVIGFKNTEHTWVIQE